MREAQYLAGQNRQTVAAHPPAPDIPAILQLLSSNPQQVPAPQPQSLPVAPIASSDLEQIFARFANTNNQQKIQPPLAQQPAPSFNLQAALANMSQSNQYGTPQAAPVANLQSLLAGINGLQPAPQAPQMQGYGFPSQFQNENDRKRQYEQDDGDYGFGKGKRSRQGGGQVKKPVSVYQLLKPLVSDPDASPVLRPTSTSL